MAKKCPKSSLNPFWIKVETRDLTMSFASSHDTKKDISYMCSDYSFKDKKKENESMFSEGYNLSDWFYSTVKKMKELEAKGKMFVFEINAFPDEKYHYCENENIREVGSSFCTEFCKDIKESSE